MNHVTVKSRPNCVACRQTVKFLESNEVPHTIEELTAEEAVHWKSQHKYMSAPVVVVDAENHWNGFRPDNLNGLLREV